MPTDISKLSNKELLAILDENEQLKKSVDELLILITPKQEEKRHCYVDIRDGVVVGVKDLSGPIADPNSIVIPEYDTSLLNQFYINGEFIAPVYYVTLDENGRAIGVANHPSNRPKPRNLPNAIKSNVPVEIGSTYADGRFLPPDPQKDMEDRIVSRLLAAMKSS